MDSALGNQNSPTAERRNERLSVSDKVRCVPHLERELLWYEIR